MNRGEDPACFLAALPLTAVGEIHLAGFTRDTDSVGAPLLIDAQGSAIDDAVWSLYRQVVERIGPAATLIEWDNDVPGFSTLHGQACIAPDVMSAETQKLAAGA